MAVAHRGVAPRETEAPLRTDGALTCRVGRHWLLDSLGDGWEVALGWTRDELTSRPFADFIHPADRSAVLAFLAGASGGGETVLETRFRARAGAWRRIRWVPTPDPGDAAPVPIVRERVVTVAGDRASAAPRSAIAMACALVILVAGVVYGLSHTSDAIPGLSGADPSVTVPRDAIGAPLVPTRTLVSGATSRSERH